MFKLRDHVRKNVQSTAIAAGALSALVATSVATADIFFDPGHTGKNYTGGQFASGASAGGAYAAGGYQIGPGIKNFFGGGGNYYTDDSQNVLDFQGVAGTVNVNPNVYGSTYGVNFYVPGYNLTGASINLKPFGGYIRDFAAGGTTTVNAAQTYYSTYSELGAVPGATLVVNSLSVGQFQTTYFDGGGNIKIGTLTQSTSGGYNPQGAIDINGNTTVTIVAGNADTTLDSELASLNVEAGSTLTGAPQLYFPTGNATVPVLSIAGILAPGLNGLGTLSLNSAHGTTLTFGATSELDLMATNGTLSDGISLFDEGSGRVNTVGITTGAVVNITGLLNPGVYNIISDPGSDLSYSDSDFTIGTAPAGDTYTFNETPGGLQLIVTAVPEPATFGLFCISATGLLSRRRRRVC